VTDANKALRKAPGLMAAACALLVASCATEPPPRPSLARHTPHASRAPVESPGAREASGDRGLVAEAQAFESYMRHARGIEPAFSGPGEVSQALATGASHEPAELQSGMVAYAALAALQEPRFVAAVKADRGDLARRLAEDPRAALDVPGGEAAGARASGALYAQGAALSGQGEKVKRASYAVQRQSWSNAKVPDPGGRLARVKHLSATGYQPSREDAEHLQAALTEGGARRPGPASPLVARGVALAALSVLGETRQAHALMSEPRTTTCLHMAKLNLYQCLASAGPHYEDIYCLGQHAMIDTGQCVVEATKAPAGRQVAMTRTSYAR
jgi:hypothetical protein